MLKIIRLFNKPTSEKNIDNELISKKIMVIIRLLDLILIIII